MNIEITNAQSTAINNLLAMGKKIDAIKALRDYYRPPGYNYDGFPNPCTLSLKEAKDAIEHRMGANDSPSAKLIVKDEFRIVSLSLSTQAGYVDIQGSGIVDLPSGTTTIEDLRKIVETWDRLMK
jgi:hypothetical protein